MSFILEALKKLEQKKQKGAVPDLMTIHTPVRTETKKRPVWPYLVIAALLLNAGILAFMYRPSKSGQERDIPPAVSERQAVSSAIVRQEQQEILTKTIPDLPPSDTVKEKSGKTAVKSDESVQQTAVPIQEAPQTNPSSGPLQAGASAEKEHIGDIPVPAEQTAPDEPAASFNLDLSAQELDALRSRIKEEQSAERPVVTSVPEPEEKTETKTGEPVPEFNQLPSDIKDQLPSLSISGHIYSNNPGSRIATVNGEIVREGENVIKGLKVDEITMNGIVFSFSGVRFLVRAF